MFAEIEAQITVPIESTSEQVHDVAKTCRQRGQDKRATHDNDDTLDKLQDDKGTRPAQVLQIRCRTSEKQLIDFDDGSELYKALLLLPRRLCGPKQFGIWMSRTFYKGQWKNPNYAENRVKDHLRGIASNEAMGNRAVDAWTPLTYELLRITAKNMGFLTYDKLEEVLVKRGYVWNRLISMKNDEREDLTRYPQMSEADEERERVEREAYKARELEIEGKKKRKLVLYGDKARLEEQLKILISASKNESYPAQERELFKLRIEKTEAQLAQTIDEINRSYGFG